MDAVAAAAAAGGGGGGGRGGGGGNGGSSFPGTGNGNRNGNEPPQPQPQPQPPSSANPNENILCGKRIRVMLDPATNTENKNLSSAGSSGARVNPGDLEGDRDGGVIVRVVDRCTSCAAFDLGLSPGVFRALGDEQALRDGRAKGVWEWVG